jgi:signal transduction histidine kinase
MMPGTLLKLGLVAALEDMCDKISKTNNLQIEFHAFDLQDRLDEAVEITIYRMVQETLNNIIKHAKAEEVIVQLSKQDDSISITVEDDGIGFNVSQARAKGGMGMRNLDSRVKYLDGKLDIVSEQGKGTSIIIELPIKPD